MNGIILLITSFWFFVFLTIGSATSTLLIALLIESCATVGRILRESARTYIKALGALEDAAFTLSVINCLQLTHDIDFYTMTWSDQARIVEFSSKISAACRAGTLNMDPAEAACVVKIVPYGRIQMDGYVIEVPRLTQNHENK